MGLDISVLKPINPEGVDLDALEIYVYTLSERPELKIFTPFIFDKENEYYDVDKAVVDVGYDPQEVECISAQYGNDVIFEFRVKEDDTTFEITNPSTYKKIEKCIVCKEVGYQRKGANKQFYKDGMWDSDCVLDSKTLNEHWEKYFSFETPSSAGDGFGSSVEYELSDEDRKNRFKKNIIDNFVEGETFVVYH